MSDETYERARPRRYRARAGITALNLITPGLGLVRVGNWRAGVLFLLAPFALLGVITAGLGHLPITSYGRAVLALAALLALVAAMYVVPAVLTWRESRFHAPAPRWTRWYALAAIAIAVLLASQLARPLMHHFYKPFYAPAETMAPTIGKGDKFVVDMRWRGPLRRGAIIVFQAPDGVRVSRIAALAGDRIAMRDGVPILNGAAAVQTRRGQAGFIGYDGLRTATLLSERLPGEASIHRVLDSDASEFDTMEEVVVPPNRLFVLGDNRDRSADSRVPAALGGVGMVPLAAIVGRPIYIHWSRDHAKIGSRLDE